MKKIKLSKEYKNKLLKKDQSLKKRYLDILLWNGSLLIDKKIYPKRWGHKYKTLVDNSDKYIDILNALKLKFSTGNDAPRGGKEGDYIKISKKAIKKIERFICQCK